MELIQLSLFPDDQDFSVLSPDDVIRNVIYDKLKFWFGMSDYECPTVMNHYLMTAWLGKPTIDTVKFDKWLNRKHNYTVHSGGLNMEQFIKCRYSENAFKSIEKHLW